MEEGKRWFEVVPTYHRSLAGQIGLNVANPDQVEAVISRTRPDVIVHAAAETDVDRCEMEKDWTMKVNAEGTKNIAQSSSRVGAKVIYVSTDYVFDGEEGRYDETHPPNPVNHYGLSKLRGEEYVQKLSADRLIVRASVIFGWHPSKINFVTWVIRSLRQGKRIDVVADHYNTPTFAPDLARGILQAVGKNGKGVFHMAGGDRLSRFEFAVRIAERFGLPKELIKPIGMVELKAWIAKRPRDSSLNCERAARDLGVRLPTIDESLSEMKRMEHDGQAA